MKEIPNYDSYLISKLGANTNDFLHILFPRTHFSLFKENHPLDDPTYDPNRHSNF